ncbi:MAG TPA: hypothetical protein VFP37_08650 [Steroidobacteraceae bacterium]|nr:hypothetical protein [Steroidobacteraceae bacterium]
MRSDSWWLAALLGAGLCSIPAAAADADKQLSLTIYNGDLALIEHVRPITLEAGRQRLEFPGVSAQILPQTVSFMASNLELLEVHLRVISAKDVPVTFELRQAPIDQIDSFRVKGASLPARRKAGDWMWRFTVAANGEAMLSYKVGGEATGDGL